jgi:phosphomannomutase
MERDPDPKTRDEVAALIEAGDLEALEARFSGRLAFGTAGLRGVLGAGPTRMNELVVWETSLGLGRYLLDTLDDAAERGVVVARDARRGSPEYAARAARALASLGIKVHLLSGTSATPLCAWAVTELHAAAGVMVTASHNPPEYNGYKVYWGNGAQIIPPHDSGIAAAIDAVAQAPLQAVSLDDARARGLIVDHDRALAERYLEGVAALDPAPDEPGRGELTVVYTPMHGVGAALGEEALRRAGFTSVHTVAAQREPDGEFPTVRFPNPEEPGAMDLALELAREVDAHLVLANDPDADRMAVAVPKPDGDWMLLTGDQIGALLAWDRIGRDGPGEPGRAVATTIVSSQLLSHIAAAHDVAYFETLTGFKWIANGALARPDLRFLMGYEEAIGYTLGELVRDKDGISAMVGMCALASHLASSGRTLLDALTEIYQAHGVWVTSQVSLMIGQPGGAPAGLVSQLRADGAPAALGERAVRAYTDLESGTRRLADGSTERVDLPRSNVLVYHLEGDARVIIRPSGTEPKIKSYYEVRRGWDAGADLLANLDAARADLDALSAAHQATLRGDA